jgi:signal transduction histidine kinase
MHRAQQAFAAHLDLATSPDRRRLEQAFSVARATQTKSLWVDIVVASVALSLMGALSWRIIVRTVQALRAVSDGVERLAGGEFGHEIDVTPGDELGDLAREANRTAVRLRAYRERAERDDWIKTGLAELADRIAGDLDRATLGGKSMRYLADYVGAAGTAVYTCDDDNPHRLDLIASAGVPLARSELGAAHDVRVEPGEVGQVVVVPLLHDEVAMGAIELAMTQPPTERAVDLLSRARRVIGTAFRVAESRERERELLVETQRQAAAAQTANKELEAFSYSVSHDLRAPLRGIDGFSQALLEDYTDALPAKGQDYLRRIRTAAQRMAELIDDLLRLSRVSRGEFRRERVDLSAMVKAIVTELRRTDGERDVEVRAQSDVRAEADPRLIRITLENLLGNAWKFTAGTAAPVIEFGARDDGGERVYFVRDNGAGFDMKYADRLFGAFQRLHTDKEFPGTGIGLATVQRIILRHGGRIWVDAAVAKGAAFHFTLPVHHTGASAS